MKKRMQILLFCLLFVSLMVMLEGCGSAATPEPTPAPEEGEIPEPTAAAPTEVPEEEIEEPEEQVAEEEIVTVRYGLMEEPDCLYSYYHCATIFFLSELHMEGLNALGPNCRPIPRLAKSIELSEDELTRTIKLQEGATWNDGEPLDATDLVAFFDWITPLPLSEWHMTTLHAVSWDAIDENTFQFTTAEPLAGWENGSAVFDWVVPPQIYADMDDDEFWSYATDDPVTAGPYKIVEWNRGSYIVFEARPEYWAGKPPVDRAVAQFYGNPDAMINALSAGEIDVIPNGIPPQYVEQLEVDPNITVVEQPGGRLLFLTFNMSEGGNKHPAIEDPKVREAIEYAINKQQIIDVSLYGKGMICPMASNCGPMYGWHVDPSAEPTPYDAEKAKSILDEAGYLDTDGDGVRETPDGEPLVFRLIFDLDFPPNESAAEYVSSYLAEIGIDTEVTAMEHGTLWSFAIYEHDFDIIIRQQVNELDPGLDDWPYGCWSAEGGGGNVSGFCDPEFDDLVLEIRHTMGDERLDLIHEEQRILAEVRPEFYLAGVTAIGAYRSDRLEIPHDACPYWSMLLGYYPIMNTVVK